MKHIPTFESFLNEAKLDLNSTIKTSTKEYTWIYPTGKDSSKIAVEINKQLNKLGIRSFISKTTGDTVAIPTKDLKTAFDEVLSNYSNIKQFAYSDGTKNDKSIVNEAKEFNVKDLPKGAIVTFKDGETWKVTKVIGNSSDPRGYMMAPHDKTKEHYISMQIEFNIKKLEDDIESVA